MNTKSSSFYEQSLTPLQPQHASRLALYYVIESSAVRALKMTANQLQVSLQLYPTKISQDQMNRKALRRLNIHAAPPTFYDHKVGLCLWEAKPIMIYMATTCQQDSSLYPSSPQLRAEIDQWLYFDSTILERCFQQIWYEKYFFERDATVALHQNQQEIFNRLNHHLKGKNWMVGDVLTLADLAILATVTSFVIVGDVNLGNYENILGWMKSMMNSVIGFGRNESDAFELKRFLQAVT